MSIDRRSLLKASLLLPLLPRLARGAPADGLTRYVDPFIGTDGTGHCFPGPSRPFGMVQPGPDNADTGWAYTSGYQYRAPTILGFSQTRASGTGIPELGDVLLQPIATSRDEFASGYDKASETARPGYYGVDLTDNQVRVELTATQRVALHRYRFPRGGRVWVLVDTAHRLRFQTEDPIVSADVATMPVGVEGSMVVSNWTTRTVAFQVLFDRPVAELRTLAPRGRAQAPRHLFGFDVPAGGVVCAKIALSTTDVAGARRNMGELQGWDFDAVASAADAEWGELLGRARIDADARTLRIFYTALYHLFLQPSVISDVDGRYRGPTGAIARARGRHYYSTLSLWDTFRAAHPLYTLLIPERVDDFVLTMLDHHAAQGYLPMWPIWGGETHCMIGNPALPVIADAWGKGIRGYDGREALAAMVASSTRDHPASEWSVYDRFGYYPFDRYPNESVSRTLEAGIGDAATARMATMLGDAATAARFAARSASYRRLLDPETRLARGRDSQGAWRTPFDPLQTTSPLGTPGDYTEANAWQYTWTPALHDLHGLIAAMGGRAAFTAQLDRFFSLAGRGADAYQGQEGLIGQYAHGNEPSHHVAWLYAYSDRPARTAQLTREIVAKFYSDAPDGITGNDDCGQMSAWLVFAMLGFYPLDPASGRYVLARPLVEHARLALARGRELEVVRHGSAVARLDRRGLGVCVDHRDLVRGGVLRFART